MILCARSKYWVRSSRTLSGSRCSANGVNPTKSTNSTEQRRRSATTTIESSSEPEESRIDAPSYIGVDTTFEPQFAQNGLPSMSSDPHDEQSWAMAAPQFAQNRLPSGVSPWHDRHCMMSPRLGII